MPSIDDMAEWILREGSKTRFRYRRSDGRLVRDARTLDADPPAGVPPAWTRRAHRRQSAQSPSRRGGWTRSRGSSIATMPRAVERGQLRKYYRVRELAKELPELRRRIRRDAAAARAEPAAVAAAVVQLVSESSVAIGGERYSKENRTFGITTLLKAARRDRGWSRDVRLRRQTDHPPATDRRQPLARAPRRASSDVAGRAALSLSRRPAVARSHARDVNAYLHDRLGVPFSAKDFRTWGGTLRAATVLAELGPARLGDRGEAKRRDGDAARVVGIRKHAGDLPDIVRASDGRRAVRRRRRDDPAAVTLPLDGGRVRTFAGRARAHSLPRHALSRAETPRAPRWVS